MIVTLDARRLDMSFDPNCTLETLIEQVRAAHDRRLIVSVAVDGRPLTEDDLQQALGEPLGADTQVDLQTGDARALVGDALRALARQFEEASRQHAGLAERLTTGDSGEALREIGAHMTLWQTCHQALIQCSGLLHDSLAGYRHEGRSVQEWSEDVIGKLVEIRGALEARDLVLLSDLIRYELPPLCETWHGLLDGLAEQVRSGAACGTTAETA
jgi:hypothetical protein